jgi:hypothetical protein
MGLKKCIQNFGWKTSKEENRNLSVDERIIEFQRSEL